MAKGIYTGADGTARQVKKGYIGIDGVARKIKKAYIGVDGTAHLAFAAEAAGYGPVFADNSWAAIIQACKENAVPDTWQVGDQKAMTINGTDYTIDIIGKDHDTYADGSGTAALTFQMHDCYAMAYPMNSTDTNAGGWTDCAMRSTHLPAILALLPSEVQAGIREVNKLTSAGSMSRTISTTADKLFLLSEIEVFGSVSYSVSGEGTQYAYYKAGNSKIKNQSGSAYFWWERSPYRGSSVAFCFVNGIGNAFSAVASGPPGVAFGFCF